jgi:hypothetical protein
VWEIIYDGVSYTLKHSIGLMHIRQLIIKQGEWINCTDLKRISSEALPEDISEQYLNMSGKQLETENLSLFDNNNPEDIIEKLPLSNLKKNRDLLIERKEVNNFNSPEEKINQLNTLEFIEKYLKKVTDKKGQSRKMKNKADTDRKAVSAAINRCRKSFREHRDLYTHFRSFIKARGNAFRYLPDRPIDWKTE